MYKYKKRNTKRGAALMISVLFFLLVSIAVVLGAVGPFVRELKSAQDFVKSKSSYYLAEAGSEDVIYRLKNGMQTSSTNSVVLGGETSVVDIIDIGGNEKEITAEGNVSSHIRRIKSELVTSVSGVSFFYGAQVGEGGLEMDENARVEGAGGAVGNVYSNGPVVGFAGSVITGDVVVATGITEDVQARSTVCNQDQIVGQSNPNIDYAQSFTPGTTGPLAKVSIYIKKVGSPSSRTVKIVADNAGSPGTTELASGTLNSSFAGSNYSWVDVVFSSPPSLINGQIYWIVLDANRNSSKYWVWCSDSNNGFGNGVAKYSEDWDDDSWTLITGDLTFKTYSGGGVSYVDNVRIDGTVRANTITNSSVGGDAYYQTISSTSVSGTEYPGSADPAVLGMPISDANIAQWKADAAAGGIIVGDCGDTGDPSCVIADDGTLSLGPKKIDGDLNLSTGKQTLSVTGVLHITGNVDINGSNTIIQCDSSFGDNSCTIVVDGWVHVANNITFSGSGQPDSYLMVLTTLTGCTGSGGSGCTHHDGAIDIHNNAQGAIFYATDSMINLHNNVSITSAIGYKLRLDNNAVITYETGITNPNFSSGPGGSWNVKTWMETE